MVSQSRGNVLVVDDVALNLDVAEAILSEAGYTVTRAANGAQAIAAAKMRARDAILLDIQMPDLDGWTVCRILKADPQTQPVPIIFMTAAYGDDTDVIRGFEMGGADYVTKPVHPRILTSRVGIAVRAYRAQLEERKVAEQRAEALRALQAAQAQALEARKLSGLATMARGLAHELNNPLAAALADVEFLRSCHGSEQEQDEALDAVLESLRRVARIVDRMRRLGADIETDAAGSLDEIVRAAVLPAIDSLAVKRIRLDYELSSSPPVRGVARMAPVVTELITNASRALNEGGRITVRTFLDGDSAVVTVDDDGHGMDDAVRDKCFEPFFTVKKDWRAIGLGLPMCHTIVTGLGGTIFMDSAPGLGTRVTIKLPLDKSDADPTGD
ncbi:MAG: hybrid sensor histidine kinase/response regulator [Deltaproteobacteria bacterium]|nr:hybrid sensor histidine kinase/response regulator [Deltaproteobacteria bacterium]